jgi:ATP-dependent phosphofructokinase / diphosphate-dependent phosphofructokinase
MAGKSIGILTAGGDCPGLNAAIRGVGKPALDAGMEVIGFTDGFRGLVENRTVRFEQGALSGILTLGGTILGTSRDKPHKMPIGDREMDMTDVAVANYHKQHLDVLVCLGGGGTQKNALRLTKRDLNIITLPKTIDNDVAETDMTFGFDTAMTIAAEAIDRLHSTAESHHRVIIVEIMGHNAGWLTLGAGVAGGADVILIPEIPFDIDVVTGAILDRTRKGKRFSIVAVAEGAMFRSDFEKAEAIRRAAADGGRKDGGKKKPAVKSAKVAKCLEDDICLRLAHELESRTKIEARVTSLGHIQRGGTPSPADRLLATQLGTRCTELIQKEKYGVMVGLKGSSVRAVPLVNVAGKTKLVTMDHPWVNAARLVGTCLGDR